MISTTKQAKREAKRLFNLCVVGGKFDQDRARQVVRAVIESRHRGCVTVLRHFHRLVTLELARHTAEVESAFPLPTALQSDVRVGLENVYGSGITTHFGLNPELLGGMRIQIGHDVFDGSVRFRLAALARTFGIKGGNGRKAVA